MYYFIIAATGNKTIGYYTGSGVSENKSDAYQYSTITDATTARRALKVAGRTYIPLTIGHAL